MPTRARPRPRRHRLLAFSVAVLAGAGVLSAAPAATAAGAGLNLPRIPWQGAQYWDQFAKTQADGWSNPRFFPIAVWWSVQNTAAEVAFDRSLGLNTYVLTNPRSDYRLIENGGMFWVGSQLPHSTASSPNWVGSFLDDEVDGRYPPAQGRARLQRLATKFDPAVTGRFRYANFTSGVQTYDVPDAVRNPYVNDYTEAVSLDQYFYSTPQCDWDQDHLRWRSLPPDTDITPANCRTSSSYGKMVDLMRDSDAHDGVLQSVWNFVEVVGDTYRLTNAQVQGAAMNSIIHGATGLIWFPQSFSGGCETGNAFREYEASQAACLAAQVQGVSQVNHLIQSLAPVLNTQSYVWNFGPGLDTMLKARAGYAYVFAMPADGGSGARTFSLPRGVHGTSAEVVGENRTIAVANNRFDDTFAAESSYHIYKIKLAG